LLITTRRKRRWTVPKGNLIKGKSPPESAAIEAFEEAGIRGCLSAEPIGRFRHCSSKSKQTHIEVSLFALSVEEEASHWPEQSQRELSWFPRERAAQLVCQPELKELIAQFTA
jgi:8-oxo-dGTP pyrophosphatase MutT (NUDIX family)